MFLLSIETNIRMKISSCCKQKQDKEQKHGMVKREEKYLNKTITVRGTLVQFVEGKSMLLNWKILKVDKKKQ